MSLQDARIEALTVNDAQSDVTTPSEVLPASSQGFVLSTDKTQDTPSGLTDDLNSYTTGVIAPTPAQYASLAAATPLTIENLAKHKHNINIRVEEEEKSGQAKLEALKNALESLGVDLPDSAVLKMLSRYESPTLLESLLAKAEAYLTDGNGSESMADTIVL